MSAETNAIVVRNIDGWPISFALDGEPRVQDIMLAERLGYARPNDIRKLIRRLMKAGKLNDFDVAPRWRDGGGAAVRQVEEFWLTQEAAALVTSQSDTAAAWEITRAIVRVFRMAIRNELPAQQALAPAAREEIGLLVEARVDERLRALGFTDENRVPENSSEIADLHEKLEALAARLDNPPEPPDLSALAERLRGHMAKAPKGTRQRTYAGPPPETAAAVRAFLDDLALDAHPAKTMFEALAGQYPDVEITSNKFGRLVTTVGGWERYHTRDRDVYRRIGTGRRAVTKRAEVA